MQELVAKKLKATGRDPKFHIRDMIGEDMVATVLI